MGPKLLEVIPVLPPGHAGSERETDGFSARHRRKTSCNSCFFSRLDSDRGCSEACGMYTVHCFYPDLQAVLEMKLRRSLLLE